MSKPIVQLPAHDYRELADSLLESRALSDRVTENTAALLRDLMRLREAVRRGENLCRRVDGEPL